MPRKPRGASASAAAGRAEHNGRTLLSHVNEGTLAEALHHMADMSKSGFGEQLKAMARKQLAEVCTATQTLVVPAVELIHNPPEDEEQQQLMERLDNALKVLRGAAWLLADVLNNCHVDPPEQLIQTAVLLHDNCLLALEDLPELQEPVARLCCRWLELKAPSYDRLAAQTLPHLLAKTTMSGRAMDVKICYTLREGFTLFDYSDESSADTKKLMLRAAMHPTFLHRPEGRKFISFLFRLHGPFVQELTAVVKNQIPSSRKSLLDAYGDIIFRAWRDSVGGPFQYDIEAYCIQDLMRAAIHAGTASLAAALRQVLGALHSQKKMVGVEAMLCRLYEPILFRAFGAANPDMRRNALLLLLDAFPVRDPQAPPEEVDESMTRQFELLQHCLTDDCPLVREAAARGIIALINNYWELIPLAVIAVFLTKLTNEVAYDSSWPGVRVAVLEGLSLLVDNPHAQPVLKKALPQLATLLGDPVLKVRESMAALLVAVSRTRTLHFYEVVPLDSLLAVMAVDAPTVSGPIQAMLLPSYFPDPEEGALHVVNLLKAKPQSGQAFCRYLVGSLVESAAQQSGGEDGDEAALDDERIKASPGIPAEHLLNLVGSLMSHMLATCTHLKAAGDTAGEGAAKKQRGKGSRATGKKVSAAGNKRRKGSVPADGADPDAADTAVAEGTVVVESESETPETWASWAVGLELLCRGLGGACQLGQCSAADVAAVVEDDMLSLLYEASPNDTARMGVVGAATALCFIPAAAAVRSLVLAQLAGIPRDGTAATGGPDVWSPELTSQVLKCLCVSEAGQRLATMMLKALGLRDAGTVHVPVGNGNEDVVVLDDEDEEGVRCGACGHSQPDEALLLCDGCDHAYHMACVRPAILEIPPGKWFCHTCEQEIQNSTMKPTAAMRCLQAMLQCVEGRQLLHYFGYLTPLVNGLEGHANRQAQRLIRHLNRAAIPATQPAAEPSAATTQDDPAPAKGKKKSGGKKGSKKKETEPEEAAGNLQEAVGLPEDWGEPYTYRDGVDVVGVYSHAALHLALAANLLPPPEEGEQEEDGGGGGAPPALEAASTALIQAQDMTEQVLATVPPSAGCLPSLLLAALNQAHTVLSTMVDAQTLSIMNLSMHGDAEQVQHVCAIATDMVQLVVRLLGARELDGCPEDLMTSVKSALMTVVQVTLLFVTTLTHNKVAPAATSTQPVEAQADSQQGVSEGQEAIGGVRLEDRLHQEDSQSQPGLSQEALVALDGVISCLMDLMVTPDLGGVTLLAPPLKQHVQALLTAVVDPTCTVPKGWLSILLAASGKSGSTVVPLQAAAADAAEPLGDVTNRANAQQGAVDSADLDEPAAGQDGGEGEKAPGARGGRGGRKATGVSHRRSRRSGKQGSMGPSSQEPSVEAQDGAAAEGSGEAQAAVSMLLTATRAKGQPELLLDQLARTASSWQDPEALGALDMLCRLGVTGLRARRLKLTGAEANLLISFDMLQTELQAMGGSRPSDEDNDTQQENQHGQQSPGEFNAHADGTSSHTQAQRMLRLLQAVLD